LLAKVSPDNVASYWAGFIWDKAGASFDSWKAYVDQFAQSLISPIEVAILAQS
jgi:hypothetical protein